MPTLHHIVQYWLQKPDGEDDIELATIFDEFAVPRVEEPVWINGTVYEVALVMWTIEDYEVTPTHTQPRRFAEVYLKEVEPK
jgi:hypothetical protein